MIEDLKNEGKIDSSGRFTLDPQRASEKLARYRLSNPHAYILHLAAGAVAAGATRLTFSRSPGGLRFEHDGACPDFDQLTQLLEVLSQSPPPAAPQRELAIAVQALRALNPSLLTLTCPSGSLQLTRRQLSVSPSGASDCQVVTISPGGIGGKIRQLLQADLPELRLLSEHFLYCPIAVETPQGLVNRLWPFRVPAWSARETPWPLQSCRVETRQATPWAWAAAQKPFRTDAPHNLEIVIHGRSYLKHEDRLEGTALVYSDTLSRDLTQVKVVEDELYLHMLDALNEPGATLNSSQT